MHAGCMIMPVQAAVHERVCACMRKQGCMGVRVCVYIKFNPCNILNFEIFSAAPPVVI